MRGLYAAKPWFVRRLRGIEDILVTRNVSADALTIAAVVISLVSGVLLGLGGLLEQPALWLFVPLLGLARLALNALDGSIARRTASARPFGQVLNEMGDRLSDVALLAPLALFVPPVLALGALVMTLMASAAGLLGVGTIGARLSNGPMGKADRVAVISIASLLAVATSSHQPFVVASIVIAIGSAVTASYRLAHLRKETSDVVR
jgi:CDP-diacylglycerol--glycerol-3-phosphate 3-phosphatidyltransferase